MTYEHDIFLSYNRADKTWVEDLAAQIESETIDGLVRSRHLKVWFDEWEINSGDNIITHINLGLKNSQFVAVVLSPEYLARPFPELEWTHLVAADPTNKSRRLIPLLLRDKSVDGASRIDLPAPFLALKYIDFRDGPQFVRKFKELIRRIRGLPPERGQRRPSLVSRTSFQPNAIPVFQPTEDAWEPDRVPDVIIGNLLPVLSIPKIISCGPTECKNAKEVVALAPKASGFILRSKAVFTFADLTTPSEPLRAAVDQAKISTQAAHDWLLNDDKSKWLLDLLNRCLERHLFTLPLTKDLKGRYFFKPEKEDADRVWTPTGERPRTVAARKTFVADGSTFWVHYGIRTKFKRIGAKFFIEIDPTYVFTSDGYHPIAGKAAGKLSIQWTGMQRNVDVLRNVSFWARIIARGTGNFLIATGGNEIMADSSLAVAKMPVGIADDQVRIRSLLEQRVNDLDEAAADLNAAGPDNFVEIETDDEGDENAEK